MKRAAVLVLTVLFAGAHAIPTEPVSCAILEDARDDTVPASTTAPGASGDLVDLVSVAVARSADDVLVDLAVADLEAAPDPGGTAERYEASWFLSLDRYVAVAERSSQRELGGPVRAWRFFARVERPNARGHALPTEASVDPAAGRIRIVVPDATLGDEPPVAVEAGAEQSLSLDEEEAEATVHARALALRSDRAPDEGAPQRSDGCPAVPRTWTNPLHRCAVATDGTGDVTSSAGSVADPGVDIVSVSMGADDRTLAIDVQTVAVPAGLSSANYLYEVWWQTQRADGETVTSFAYASRHGATDTFRFSTPLGSGEANGSFSGGPPTIRVSVPRAMLGVEEGDRLRNVRARAYRGHTMVAYDIYDETPGFASGSDASFVVSESCGAQERRTCPVVGDAAGDAGPIVRSDRHGVPPSEPALDLLAAGAETTAGAIRLSARVADLSAPSPAGSYRVGWLVSWYAGDGRRWVGQIVRAAGGDVAFSYRKTTGTENDPERFYATGIATTGSLDLANDVVTIDVPRAAVGDPAHLPGLGATSFADTGTDLAGRTDIVDRTGTRPYDAGTACPA